jgi:predicted nuclease of predicted toxin-antitoxin system
VRFLVDAQLPPALARFLVEEGHEAVAVRELALRNADDEVIWQCAKRDGFIIVTKDEDFARMVWQFGPPPQILWLRIGNATNRVLCAWLAPVLPDAVAALALGNALVEVI